MGRKKINNGKKSALINAVVKGKKTEVEIAQHLGISRSTVAKVKKTENQLIKVKKAKYIKLIDKETGGDKAQAEILNKAMKAKTEIYNFRGEIVGHRADHKIRLDTVKYIDKMKGREQQTQHLTQNNILIGKELDRYTGQ